jgi:hypothetical protein
MRCNEVGRMDLAQERSPVLGFVNFVMQLT